MTVTRGEIADTLSRYLIRHPDERPDLEPLLQALAADTDLAARATVPGHVTCGAAAIDPEGRLLMVHHKTLQRWLLPGGHLEPGDTTLPTAARRELDEETGVPCREIVSPPGMDIVPVDIDLHSIPADPAKGEPAHWHADFRYAFWVSSYAVRLQLDEVTDYGWRPLADLRAARLATKIARLAA